MIKKLIISAVVLTVLIAGKEADAAGPAAFAREFGDTIFVHVEVLDDGSDAFEGLDGYFDLFAEGDEMPT